MANFRMIILLLSSGLSSLVGGVPYVTVQQGRLFGETVDFDEDGTSTKVDVFKGIPFAEPPVRFSAPQPKCEWVGDWNATYHRPSCFQSTTNSWRAWFHTAVDEDCLYLNIFAPNPKPNKAPVMIFIHGGMFQEGTGNNEEFSGLPMAAFEQVIVVVINYRLNVFGFLSTGDNAATGNYGLLDQAEALRWVKANIEEFGGDQSRITIYGESAGAASVNLHLFSNYSRDYFDQAILESGTAIAFWSYFDDPPVQQNLALMLGSSLNCSTENTAELIECLRRVPANELYAVSKQSFWLPNRDGVFLQESPHDALVRGNYKKCPLIVGFNRDEGTLVVPFFYPHYIGQKNPPHINRTMFEVMTETVLKLPRKYTDEVIERAVEQEYVDWSQEYNESADYFLTFLPIFGDLTFSCPALDIIMNYSQSSQSVFQYFLTHVPSMSYYERSGEGTGWFLAGHVEDIPFVFGWGFNPATKNVFTWTKEEEALSRQIMKFWANFAKSGDPSRTSVTDKPGTGDMEWPSFSVPDLYYKELSLDMPIGRGVKTDECAMWGEFLEELRKSLEPPDWHPDDFFTWVNDILNWKRQLRMLLLDSS